MLIEAFCQVQCYPIWGKEKESIPKSGLLGIYICLLLMTYIYAFANYSSVKIDFIRII
jgi:hypothetical protein